MLIAYRYSMYFETVKRWEIMEMFFDTGNNNEGNVDRKKVK